MEELFKRACRKNNVHVAECFLESKQIPIEEVMKQAYSAYRAIDKEPEAKEVAVVLLDHVASTAPLALNADETHKHMIKWYLDAEWDSGSDDDDDDSHSGGHGGSHGASK
jgi:hypothetical protein